MKYYRHKITGRIITEHEYLHRISKWIKHYFEHIQNADDDKKSEEETEVNVDDLL